MAVVTRKSGPITNRDATPRVPNNSSVAAGDLKAFVGTLETVSGDNINSIYILGSVPSNAVMHALRIYADDIGTTTVADVGLYKSTADGGAVVNQSCFASAVNLNAGALNGVDILHEAATPFDISDAEKRVWEFLGLAADPGLIYDVCATLTAAADGAATITLRGFYAI